MTAPVAPTIADYVENILCYLGENIKRDGLQETPKRVEKALLELTEGYTFNQSKILEKTFETENDSMVICKDIDFYSLCEHHMLPFFGKVHIGYIPNGRVVGISKLVRLVHCFSRRLQIQETMTYQISHAIQRELKPLGVMVVVKAQHLCMKMRGVANSSSEMITSSIDGNFRQREVRSEFLHLIKENL
jgi:GTP cyclohydrolase I